MKEKIIYVCGGAYSVWMATLMNETVYRGYYSIAVIHSNSADSYNINASCFDEVHVKPDSLCNKDWASKVTELIIEKAPDCVGFFTWGLGYVDVYNSIPVSIPVILIDEGTSSYNFAQHMRVAVGEIDFSRIKEIWLLDPQISLNDPSIPVKMIPMKELLADRDSFKAYLDRLNSFFVYQEFIFDDVLLFDNYLTQAGFITDDCYQFFLNSFMMLLGDNSITVKKHPFDSERIFDLKFSGYDVHKYENNGLPWEIVALNFAYRKYYDNVEIPFPKMIFGTNTSALITTQVILSCFEYEYPVAFLNKLIHDWLPEEVNITEAVFCKYNRIYPNRKLYMPESWNEFADTIRIHFGEVDEKRLNTIDCNETELMARVKGDYSDCFAKRKRFNRIRPLIENDKKIIEFIKRKGYKSIAIYGYGDVGKVLRNLLVSEGIETIVADKTICENVVSPQELKQRISSIDMLIITPVLDLYSLREEYKGDTDIFGYEDFVAEACS